LTRTETTPLTAPAADGAHPGEGFELRGTATPPLTLLRDLLGSWDLLRTLSRKDFYVRYRRTSFGVLWAIGLPLVQAVVLGVVFTRIVRIDTGQSYAVFVFAGVLPWTFLATSVTSGSTAIVDGAALATKIYFPRALLPLVNIGANIYGFIPGVAVLLLAAATIGDGIGPDVWLVLPATVLMVVFVAALSLLLAGLHVYFRDLRFIVQAGMLAWMYGTPVIYPLDLATGALRVALLLNPATGMVVMFHDAVTDGHTPDVGLAALSTVAWTLALLGAALVLHSRRDRVFVDLL
jgi:ABC-type polysaccharide/polyol phosphate export permease